MQGQGLSLPLHSYLLSHFLIKIFKRGVYIIQSVSFRAENELEDFLSTPREEIVDMMARLDGDIIVLGIGGKMGPTLGTMIIKAAHRAGVKKNVYGECRHSQLKR